MVIRNGLRVFANNFSLVWKHLLYLGVVVALSFSLFVLSAQPTLDMLRNSGWTVQFKQMLELVYTSPQDVSDAFRDVFTNLYCLLRDNFSSVWGSYLLSILTLIVLPLFLFGIGEYVLGSLVGSKMASLTGYSYASKLVSTLGRSTRYSLVKMLVSIPFVVLLVAIFYCYGILSNTWFKGALLLPILLSCMLFVLACRYTLLVGFMPVAVTTNRGLFACFGSGIYHYTEGYFKKTLHFFALYIMEFGALLFIGIFTIGVGMLVVIPAICIINSAISFVVYSNVNKANFYVNEGTIIKPV